MKERIEVMYEGDDLESILKQVEQIDLAGATFKVIFVKINDLVGRIKLNTEKDVLLNETLACILKEKRMFVIQSVYSGLFLLEDAGTSGTM